MSRLFHSRSLIAAGLAGLTALALVACSEDGAPNSTGSGDPVKVVLWNTYEGVHAEVVQANVDAFNAANPDVRVEVQTQPLTDFESKVMQAVRNGTGPDIIASTANQATQYIEAGLVADLTGYIDDPEIGLPGYQDDLSAAWLDTTAQWGDGKRYLLPTEQTGPVLFYNKTLYDSLGLKAPATWTELAENSKAAREATGQPGFGFDDLASGVITLAGQEGQDYVDTAANQATFDDKVFVDKIDWLREQLDSGAFRLVGEDQYFSGVFGSQVVAAYIGSSAGDPFVAEAVGDQFEYAVAPVPQEGPVKYVTGWDFSYMLFAGDEAKERAAFRFMRHTVQPEALAKLCETFGSIPAYASVRDLASFQEFVAASPVMGALGAQADYAVFEHATSASNEVRSELTMAAEAALTGQKDTKAALADAAAAVNAALDR